MRKGMTAKKALPVTADSISSHCICFKHAILSDNINLLDLIQNIFFNYHIFHKPYP